MRVFVSYRYPFRYVMNPLAAAPLRARPHALKDMT